MDKDVGNKHPPIILAFKLVQAFWRAIWHRVYIKPPQTLAYANDLTQEFHTEGFILRRQIRITHKI